MIDQVAQNQRRALLLLLAFGGAIAFVVLLVAVVAGIPVIGLVVALVVGGAAAWVARSRADGAVADRLGAVAADPEAHARLHNLVEGLCLANGLAKPTLAVIDDARPNALVWGVDPQHAHLAVTSGLLEALDRIELEAVLAHELSRIKQGDTAPATVAVATVGLLTPFPGLLARAVAPTAEQVAAADASAVEMTRYPPGLVAALEEVEPVEDAAPVLAHLWLDHRTSLEVRIDTLREL